MDEMYACKQCGKTFKTKFSRDRHVKTIHEKAHLMNESESDDTSDGEDIQSNADEVWQELMNDVEDELRERIESKVKEGFSTNEARQYLLPLIQSKFSQHLIDRINLCQSLQKDSIYKLIKEAYMEVKSEDGLSGEKAWDAAVRKKQYLVDQKIEFLMNQIDDSSSSSGESSDSEHQREMSE